MKFKPQLMVSFPLSFSQVCHEDGTQKETLEGSHVLALDWFLGVYKAQNSDESVENVFCMCKACSHKMLRDVTE